MRDKKNRPSYDAVIVGGGLVGLSLALALKPLGLRVVVCERHPPSALPDAQDRPITLNHASVVLLKAWGVDVDALSPHMIDTVDASVAGALGYAHLTASAASLPFLGKVVGFAALRQALWQAVLDSEAAALWHVDEAAPPVLEEHTLRCTWRCSGEEKSLTTPLLVAADGARSMLRDWAGLDCPFQSTGAKALTAQVCTEASLGHTAFQRFTPEGVLALLPGSSSSAHLIWTGTPQSTEAWLDEDDASLQKRLKAYWPKRAPALKSLLVQARFPLSVACVKSVWAKHVMLMGNSAHAFYPVAAQGFNLSVRDVCAFSESLAARIKQGDAFGACVQDPHFFEAYYDARKSDWKRTQQYVAKAEQWGTSPLRAPLLAKALMLLDCLPDVAKPFLRHTTGMALRSRILSGLDLV